MSRPLTGNKNGAPRLTPNSVGEQILTKAQDTRPVIQEFVPLAQSLEWELGQQYFRERGNKAFISDTMPVPFVINNDGTLSRNAAEVLFASLVEAEKEDLLERRKKRGHPCLLSDDFCLKNSLKINMDDPFFFPFFFPRLETNRGI